MLTAQLLGSYQRRKEWEARLLALQVWGVLNEAMAGGTGDSPHLAPGVKEATLEEVLALGRVI